ncbi:PREDICTED: uncharacterized protein LOC109231560 [Nicotiana attenuata]|uniref:uncharacterized protein LOC109231560 n=1 Tax=Nicotiana attenuata TaxID=49451 RepID=UPI0009046186|nr:PREDICTED: uncharacterized protein LOC109231560 [Nicotiana attenuata]
MTWLIWNIRGLNKRYKQKDIKQYIKDKHIKLAGLVETKVKEGNAGKVISRIVPGWNKMTNYEYAVNGKIWIIWDEQMYAVQPLDKQDQFIHCLVTGKRNGIISKVLVINADIKDLAEQCHDIGLTELTWRGDYFTWTNKQKGVDRIWSRIDRMFGNDIWMMNYSHLSTDYGEPYISDHNPMCISIRQPRILTKSPFRFFNVWANHPDFEMIIREESSRNKVAGKMENIWVKLKRMKRQFRQLNETEFKGVAEKIDQARQTINHIQSQMQNSYNDLLQVKEKEWLQKLETRSMVEEKILQQKARANWIKLGDANNKFFSAVIKERQQRK